MSRFNTCLELERIDTEALSSRLKTIGYSIDRFPEIVDFIPIESLKPSPELKLLPEILY
jgi:hypothetical protein